MLKMSALPRDRAEAMRVPIMTHGGIGAGKGGKYESATCGGSQR